jgi:hypothetical protein
MSRKIQLIGLVAVTLLSFGCSSDSAQATPEQKKAFMGSAMPKDFMEKNAAAMRGPAGGGAPAGGAPGAAPGK